MPLLLCPAYYSQCAVFASLWVLFSLYDCHAASLIARQFVKSKIMLKKHLKFDACLPTTRQQKVAETPMLAGRSFVSTGDTAHQFQGQRVKGQGHRSRRTNAVTENQSELRNGMAYEPRLMTAMFFSTVATPSSLAA